MPSTRPQRSFSSFATASMSSGLLTSSSSTSGCGSSLVADRSVIRRTRPNEVRTTSAPASCACLATSYAIDSRLTTPVIRSFLPSRMPMSERNGDELTVALGLGLDRRVALPQDVHAGAADGPAVLVDDVPGERHQPGVLGSVA